MQFTTDTGYVMMHKREKKNHLNVCTCFDLIRTIQSFLFCSKHTNYSYR